MTATDPDLEPLAAFCTEHGLGWDAARAEAFGVYLDALLKFNRSMNLIGPMSRADVVRELLIDSVVPATAHHLSGSILDVGCGAGLPGIPLKLVAPQTALTLVEPRRKRVTFLRIARKRLALEDTIIHEARIEDVPRARFDTVISKAFQPPMDWIATAREWVAEDGCIICMTRASERDALVARAAELGLRLKAQAAPPEATRDGVADRVSYVFRLDPEEFSS